MPDNTRVTIKLDINSKEAEQSFKKLADLAERYGLVASKSSKATKSMGQASKGLSEAQSRANYALLNTTRLVSDMPYLFADWRLGIMAISNNIDPLVASLQNLKESAGSTAGAMAKLKAALLSPAGVGLAISAIVAIGTAFTLTGRKADEAKEKVLDFYKVQAEKSIKRAPSLEERLGLTKFIDNPERLSDALFLVQKKIQELNKEIKSTSTLIDAAEANFGKKALVNLGSFETATGGTKEALQKSKDISDLLQEAQKLTKEELEREKNKLKEFQTQLNLNKTIEETIQKRLKEYEVIKEMSEALRGLGLTPEGIGIKAKDIIGKGVSDEFNNFSTINNIPNQLSGVNIPATAPELPTLGSIFDYDTEVMWDKTAKSMAVTLKKNMNVAWENIFGEANSLFEQLAMNFANSLISSITDRLADVLVGVISGGGSGNILTGFLDFLGLGASPKVSNSIVQTPVVLNIDGQTIMSSVVEHRLPNTILRLRRQGRL